jgi:ribosomal protein S18 acetylase RimI-like enzyme
VTDPVAIRAATPADDAALAALDQRTWSWASSPAPAPPAGTPFFDGRSAPGDVLLAETGGAIAGYVQIGRPTPVPSNAHVLMVRGLAVDPDRRGAGIGRALVEAAVAEARTRGGRRLTLRVLGPNAPARAVYAAAGFVVEGILREEFHLDGGYVDDVLMARDLTHDGGPA